AGGVFAACARSLTGPSGRSNGSPATAGREPSHPAPIIGGGPRLSTECRELDAGPSPPYFFTGTRVGLPGAADGCGRDCPPGPCRDRAPGRGFGCFATMVLLTGRRNRGGGRTDAGES